MTTELTKETDDDEISLIDLFAVIVRRKKMILTITITAAVGAVVFSIISLVLPPEISPLPNKYSPEAHMLINDSSSSGSSLSSMLSSGSSSGSGSGLGSLAELMGVNVNGASSTQLLAVYLVSTNTFLDTVVDTFDLFKRYKIKLDKSPRHVSRKALKKTLTGEIDEESKVFTLKFADIDPQFAQSVVNFCVQHLEKRFDELGVDKNKREKANLERSMENAYKEIQKIEEDSQLLLASVGGVGIVPSISLELSRLEMEQEAQKQVYTQLKVQYEILKVTMASETPVLQIIETAEVPDQKSEPSRVLLCIIVTFAAGFLAVFIAFALNAVDNIKKDPEAMAKLRGDHHAN